MALAERAQVGVDLGTYAASAAARRLPVDLTGEVDGIGYGVRHRAAQTETVIAGIVIGATLLIGFFVVSSIDDAIPMSDIYSDPANESFVQDKNSTLDRIGDGLLIGGVVIIVLFAAVILRVLRGL